MPSKIEWTDETWNPIVGCSKVSQGCQNCYAERMAARFAWSSAPDFTGGCDSLGDPGGPFETVIENGKWNGQTELKERRLDQPLRWKKPRKIFVCSMGDFWHHSIPLHWQEKVWRVALSAARNGHTLQFLTKRPEIMAERLPILMNRIYGTAPWEMPKRIWLGVTAENQEQADKRIPLLLQTPAAVRFVSVEPMLGPINLQQCATTDCHGMTGDKCLGIGCEACDDTGKNIAIDWVICGGESGPGARPMNPDWARSLRDQCVSAQVPFMFKAWGEWGLDKSRDIDTRRLMHRIGKKKAGRLLDGREWNEYPEIKCPQ